MARLEINDGVVEPGGCGTEVPSGSRGGAPVRSGAKPPEAEADDIL